MKKKVLVIGPLCEAKSNKPIGGAVTAFLSSLILLDRLGLDYKFLNNYSRGVVRPLQFLWVLLYVIYSLFSTSTIYINCSFRDCYTMLPFLVFLKKIFGFKLLMRRFGGSFDQDFQQLSSKSQRLILWSLRSCDVAFFEILRMQRFFYEKGVFGATWLPNFRSKTSLRVEGVYRKRFAFVSQVSIVKGASLLFEVSNLLDDSYTIDVYGPLIDDCFNEGYFRNYKANYNGLLSNSEVRSVLSGYDFILLPTNYKGEGHPGILIEAYSIGMPSISTCVNDSMLEVVEDGVTGLVMKEVTVNELLGKIRMVDQALYTKLSAGAKEAFKNFSEHSAATKFKKAFE